MSLNNHIYNLFKLYMMSSEIYHPDKIQAEKIFLFIFVQTVSGIVVICSFHSINFIPQCTAAPILLCSTGDF